MNFCSRRMARILRKGSQFSMVFWSLGPLMINLCCALEPTGKSARSFAGQPIPAWVFATPDGLPYTSDNALGRTTVVLFLTTYDPASQIAATRLNLELQQLKRRVNALGVALEPPNHAILVGVFHDSLHLSYPLLMPDPATLAGYGPFGAIDVVPTCVILDSSGRQIWRGTGVNAIAELHGILGGLGAAAEG